MRFFRFNNSIIGDICFVNLGGINFETAPSSRNHIRRSGNLVISIETFNGIKFFSLLIFSLCSIFLCYHYKIDSYRNSGIKSSYLTFDRSINEQNDANSHYNTNNGAESHWSDFKQPMPPPMTNGTKRLPGLINATRPLAERKMFQRNVNQPHQTISPHYSQFGDSQHSVLGQFKAVPDLYRIKPIRSNISTSFSTSNLANGHDQSQYSSLTGTQLNRRSALNMPNSQSTSNLMTNNNSFLSNSISRRFQSSHLQTPSSFSKVRVHTFLSSSMK